MNPKLKRFYLAGLKNTEFNKDVFRADGDIPPSLLDSSKECWGLLYYGWLVGKYGKDYLKYV